MFSCCTSGAAAGAEEVAPTGAMPTDRSLSRQTSDYMHGVRTA
eukprot:CAMPEP_0176261382 /NCGR_PEP_ID=MMETSP0121_2-20121125/40069_1 /TAXON_ID=160619 /ORGANISM="Kryptoperidinium foliaceum, Strain CCMP 1326" /LENGTH=42 /DNA_ID= /DNA_START= /DNA_END= /DNA_ORIENTATION=